MWASSSPPPSLFNNNNNNNTATTAADGEVEAHVAGAVATTSNRPQLPSSPTTSWFHVNGASFVIDSNRLRHSTTPTSVAGVAAASWGFVFMPAMAAEEWRSVFIVEIKRVVYVHAFSRKDAICSRTDGWPENRPPASGWMGRPRLWNGGLIGVT